MKLHRNLYIIWVRHIYCWNFLNWQTLTAIVAQMMVYFFVVPCRITSSLFRPLTITCSFHLHGNGIWFGWMLEWGEEICVIPREVARVVANLCGSFQPVLYYRHTSFPIHVTWTKLFAWRWRQPVSPKRRNVIIISRGVIIQPKLCYVTDDLSIMNGKICNIIGDGNILK